MRSLTHRPHLYLTLNQDREKSSVASVNLQVVGRVILTHVHPDRRVTLFKPDGALLTGYNVLHLNQCRNIGIAAWPNRQPGVTPTSLPWALTAAYTTTTPRPLRCPSL